MGHEAASVRVRPNTRRKLGAICRACRWTLTAAIDAVTDEFVARHGILLTEGNEPAAPAASNGSSAQPMVLGRTDITPATEPVSASSPDQASSSLPQPSVDPAAPDGEQPASAIPTGSVEASPPD